MKLKTKETFLILFLVLIIGGASYYFSYYQNIDKTRVCFGNNCLKVEVVDTFESRARGLMFREELGKNEGMLFIFEEEGIYPFWMKNTLIPLDIIWINSEKNVVYIHENAVPLNENPINPRKNALYVLEIRGGRASEIGINAGDDVEIYLK